MLTRKHYLCLSYAHSVYNDDDWRVVGLADDPDAWGVVRERALIICHDEKYAGWRDASRVAAVRIVELTDEEFNAIADTEDMRLSLCWNDDNEDESPC